MIAGEGKKKEQSSDKKAGKSTLPSISVCQAEDGYCSVLLRMNDWC